MSFVFFSVVYAHDQGHVFDNPHASLLSASYFDPGYKQKRGRAISIRYKIIRGSFGQRNGDIKYSLA